MRLPDVQPWWLSETTKEGIVFDKFSDSEAAAPEWKNSRQPMKMDPFAIMYRRVS